MRNLYRSLLCFIIFSFIIPNKGFSSHIVGGALTYTYNGGNNYTVMLKLYRDCSGIAFPANVAISVLQADGSLFAPSRNFTMNGGAIINIPAVLPPCATAPAVTPCVEERTYTISVNLAPAPGGMHLVYSLCCRNPSILNITLPASAGETFYAFIPCYFKTWTEDFTLADGTTSDAGPTAWTRTITGAAPAPTAAVANGSFEVTSQNNALGSKIVYATSTINISAFAAGVNLSVNYSEPAGVTLENTDSIKIYYSINGGAKVLFPVNGQRVADFNTNVFATATGLIGNTVEVFVRIAYGALSPNDEIYHFDMVTVYDNTFVPNSSPSYNALPPLFVCSTNTFALNQSATDLDGDVLVYSMYTPYNDAPAPTFTNNVAGMTPVNWVPSYTATSPFNSPAPSVTLNPVTGIMSGVANTNGQFVFGVKCQEFRGAVLLSEMVRDYQMNTVTCPPFVPPPPVAGANTPLCVGQLLSLTASTVAGATYTWNGPNGFTSNLQNPTIPGVTLLAAGVYSVRAIVAGCTGLTGTVAVVVNPNPAAPVATNNSTICSGSTLSLFASTIATATYSWTGPNVFSSALQNPTIVGATTLATGMYSVYATVLGCNSPVGTTSVTVNPIPLAPIATNNSTICSGATLNLFANLIAGATYSWTGPNAFSSALQNPTIVGATTLATGMYSVYVTVGGCNGPIGTTSVTVNPIPLAPIATNNSTICAGQTLNLFSNLVAGATYSWAGPNAFTSTLQNPTIVGATTLATGMYSVYVTVGGCNGPIGTTSVTINPLPLAPIATNNSTICAGATLNLFSNLIAGATYSWSGPNAFTSTLQNPTIVGATTLATGMYSVYVTVGGCNGPIGTTSVTINPLPLAPIATNNSTICSGSTLNLFSNLIAGASYSWTGPNAFTSTLQNPTIVGATTLATGMYSVYVTVGGCNGPIGTTSVTINPIPLAPIATNNSTICSGSTLNLFSNLIAGASYSWTGPNAFTSTLQNPTIVGATTLATGMYSVYVTVGGCNGPIGTTSVTVNPIPIAPIATNNSTICSGATLNLFSNLIAGATYSWSGPNSFTANIQNPTIVGATTLATGMYSVYVTVGGCNGLVGTTSVTINPIPLAPIATNNSTICSGSTLNLFSNLIGGATYSWTGPNAFSSNLQNPSIVGATTLATGVYSVYVTVGGCNGPIGTTSVTINPIPLAPIATNNSTLCTGSTLNLFSNLIAGATYSWTGPNAFTSALQNPTIVGATTLATGMYSVYVTVGGCIGPIGTTSVTISPIPIAPIATNNSTICAGQTLSLSASTTVGATYTWSGPNSFTANVQNPTIVGATTLATGVYTVFVTIVGCPSPIGTTSVTINPLPLAPIATNNSTICSGQTLNLFSNLIAGATYSWTGPNAFSSSLQNPSIVGASTLAAGVYSVYATVGGCPGPIGTTSVTVNQTPGAPIATNNSTLCTGQTLNLFSNLIAGATYSWSGPNAFTSSLQNPTIVGATTLATGMYSVYVTVGGCTGPIVTTSVTISDIPPAPIATNNSTICAGQTLNLSATFTVGGTYTWSGPNSFTANVQNPTIVGASTLASGVYSVFVTIVGCPSPIGTTSVTVNPLPLAPIATNNSTICSGQTLNLFANFIAGATYSWTGPNTFTDNVQNPSIVGASTLAAGIYSVFATVNGCPGPIGTTSVTINPTPLAPIATNNSTLCTGGTLSLTANTIVGATYSWSGPNAFASGLQNPTIVGASTLATGMYSVFVTVNGCTGPIGTTSVTISDIPPAPIATNNSPICANSTLSLSASFTVGGTYTWIGPNSFTSNVQNPTIVGASTLASGVYSVFVTVVGCPSPFGVTSVTVNPSPLAPIASNNSALCPGQTLSLTANTIAAATYSWSGPNGFSSSLQNPVVVGISTLDAGVYSVYVNVAGCNGPLGTTNVTINPTPPPPTGNSNSPVCNGQDLIFNITPSGGIYSWTGPNSFTSSLQNPTISPAVLASTGNYSVTITLLGCTSSVAVIGGSVGVNPSAAIPSANSPLCTGNTLSLSATFSPGVSYNWTGPNAFASALQNPTLVAIGPAAGVYTVVSSLNGCNGPASTIIVVIDVPAVVDIGPRIDTICASAVFIPLTGTITGNYTNSLWTTLGSGTFAPTNSLATTYTMSAADVSGPFFELVLTSFGGGCPSQNDTIRFMVLTSPTVDVATSLNICKNAFVPFSGTITGVTNTGTWTANGGTGIFNPGTNTLNGTYIPSSADTTAGFLTLILTSTNNKGCLPNKDSIMVTFIRSPFADFSNSLACANQTISFTDLSAPSNSLGTFSWDFGDASGGSVLANPVHTYSSTSTFTVIHLVTLTNGCFDTIKKSVTVYNSPVADFTYSSVCVGYASSFFDQSTIVTDTIVTWNWTFGNGSNSNIKNPTSSYTLTGNYVVNFTVTTNKGCPATITKTITVNPNPIADFTATPQYVLAYDNVNFIDQSAPAPTLTNWTWNFANIGNSTSQNPNFAFPDKGIYPVRLIVKDNNGCLDTVTKDIFVTLLPLVPTAFTPNGDGSNDILFVKGGPFKSLSFRCYNSWGELLFVSDVQEKGWDGSYKGQPVPLGVYVWILDVELYNGTFVRKTGDVTVLK